MKTEYSLADNMNTKFQHFISKKVFSWLLSHQFTVKVLMVTIALGRYCHTANSAEDRKPYGQGNNSHLETLLKTIQSLVPPWIWFSGLNFPCLFFSSFPVIVVTAGAGNPCPQLTTIHHTPEEKLTVILLCKYFLQLNPQKSKLETWIM